jgi:FkbM family methyltransferase
MTETTLTVAGGIEISCLNRAEAEFMDREVPSYFAEGVRLDPGAVVIDAGANIGVFSMHVAQRTGGQVRILAFEPLPAVFAVLEQNAARLPPGVLRPFPHGLSAAEGEADFTYFPLMTVLSSSHRGAGAAATERGRVTELMLATAPELQAMPRFLVEAFVGQWMGRTEVHRARLRPLSAVIAEERLERIDLLKIDVEGAELEVLEGIAGPDWPKIAQVVVEVETYAERAPKVRALLESKGLAVPPGEQLPAGDFGLVFGFRT